VKKTKIEVVIRALNEGVLTDAQVLALFKIIILFINSPDEILNDFGYRLILKASNITRNYTPLYDVAINLGYIPLAKMLERGAIENRRESFIGEFTSSYKELFQRGGIYLTEKQAELQSDVANSSEESLVIVAPTSYGKSELIEGSIQLRNGRSVCIIVPSKALISQTRRRIHEKLGNESRVRIITHHDMYAESDSGVVAVLTQERLLRLLQKNKELSFDIVFVDEAHNLLNSESRSVLLSCAIIILNKRNPKTAFKYLTPFIADSSSIKLLYTQHTSRPITIKEKLKSENFFVYDFKEGSGLLQYDQFLNAFYSSKDGPFRSDVELISSLSRRKNIVYLNKSRDIEKFAKILAESTSEPISEAVKKACEDIADYVHEQYSVIEYLKKGVAYHHGSVPDVIRIYIEDLFRKEICIRWIVTSSTLLEGVNIPAESLFILDPKKGRSNLTPSQFKNLVGRVCRFSEIFHKEFGGPALLEPNIYLIASGYISKKANITKYISSVARVDQDITDVLKNPLLENIPQEEEKSKALRDAEEFLENQEQDMNIAPEIKKAVTPFGKACFENNVTEINVVEVENQITALIFELGFENVKINSSSALMDAINKIFVSFMPDSSDNRNLLRLRDTASRNFYRMFLNWRMEQPPYKLMISHFLRYWQNLVNNQRETLVFVGSKWGTTTRGDSHTPYWVEIKDLSIKERVNLAIVRIKEEQDFLDNQIIKFVEVMNEIEILEPELYNLIKYGTNDETQIALIQNGFSHQVAKLLSEDYSSLLSLDSESGVISIDSKIVDLMESNSEHAINIFEVKYSGLIDPDSNITEL
jgi:superfamily II DNA or RNA helicase